MRSKIAVLGEKESVQGFKAVGFEVFEESDPQAAEELIHRLAEEQYGVIFITEQLMSRVLPAVDRYKTAQIPAIIPIPGREGSLGLGIASVKKSVERAVGADILFKD